MSSSNNAGGEADMSAIPENAQDLTIFVQTLLDQMVGTLNLL